MNHEKFRRVKLIIGQLGLYRKQRRQSHSDGAVLAVYFWAHFNNKPVYWATRRSSWGPGMWRGELPSQSCMSRRLVCDRLTKAIARIAACAAFRDDTSIVALLDGKPTEIALHSEDEDAGTGRGVGHVARGYKLHAIVSAAGTLLTWRIEPLNVDERVVALEMIKELSEVCYIVADSNYHAERLFIACEDRGMQLVSPRKKSHQGKSTRDTIHPSRARSVAMLEKGDTRFGDALMTARTAIERFFAQLSNAFGTIAHLPIWVRSRRRVTQWIDARIALAHICGSIPGSPMSVAA